MHDAGTFFECLGLCWPGLVSSLKKGEALDKAFTSHRRLVYILVDVCTALLLFVLVGWVVSRRRHAHALPSSRREEDILSAGEYAS